MKDPIKPEPTLFDGWVVVHPEGRIIIDSAGLPKIFNRKYRARQHAHELERVIGRVGVARVSVAITPY